MHDFDVISLVFAAVWVLAAVVALRARGADRSRSLALPCALLAAAHAAAAAWAPLTPFILAAWATYALALPSGRLRNAPRRVLAASAGVAALVWAVVLAANDDVATTTTFVIAALATAAIGAAATGLRWRKATVDEQRSLQWLAAAAVLAIAFGVVCASLDLMTGDPQPLAAWLSGGLLLIPIGQLCSSWSLPRARLRSHWSSRLPQQEWPSSSPWSTS